jgi:hypothetical protein
VRYGVLGAYTYRTVSNTITCDDASFGAGPTPYQNYCEYSSTAGSSASSQVATPTITPVVVTPPSSTSQNTGNIGPTNTSIMRDHYGKINANNGQVIENLRISNPNGTCIQLNGVSNVTIRNVIFVACGPQSM